jgi:hypothetical protein
MYDMLKLFRTGRAHMALLTQPHLDETRSPQGSTLPPTSVPPTSTRKDAIGDLDGTPNHDRFPLSFGAATPTRRNGQYQHPTAQKHDDLHHYDLEGCPSNMSPTAMDSQINAVLHRKQKEGIPDTISVIVDAPASSNCGPGPPAAPGKGIQPYNSAPLEFDETETVASSRAVKSTDDLSAPPSLRGDGPLSITSKRSMSMRAIKSIKRFFRQEKGNIQGDSVG